MLTQGEFVLLFVGQTEADCAVGVEDAAMGSGDSPPLTGSVSEWMFAHIAQNPLSPWLSWFQAATPVAGFQPSPLRCQPDLQVRVDGQFLHSRRWLQRCALDMRWSVVLLRVDWTSQLLGTFVPNVLKLLVANIDGGKLRAIWDPFKEKEWKHKDAGGAWASTLLEGDDEGADGSDAGGDDAVVGSDLDNADELDEYDEEGQPEDDEDEASSADESDTSDTDSSGGSVEYLAGLVGAPVTEGDPAAGTGAETLGSGKTSSTSSTSSSSEASSSSGSEDEGAAPGDSNSSSGDASDSSSSGAPNVHNSIELTPFCTLTFFGAGSRRDFIVRCKTHTTCVLIRTANASEKVSKAGQGRPLGLCMAWALKAEQFPDKSHVRVCKPTLAERKEARASFEGMVGAPYFSAHERPKRVGEEEEPERMD